MAANVENLRICVYPDPALRQRGAAIDPIDDHVRAVAARMIELMREAEGVGLAAPQIGLPWQLFVAHAPGQEDEEEAADSGGAVDSTPAPIVCVNPSLSDFEGAPEPHEEGCLSLPDIRGDVLRPPIVTLTATDLDNQPFSIRCSGLLARCVQHECDHLDGVLIIDKMVQMSRMKNRTLVRDLERSAQRR